MNRMLACALGALVTAALAPEASAKAFVIPHILEKGGTIQNTPFTFDTTIFAMYTPGLPGTTRGNGAGNARKSGDVDMLLYLYDDDSTAMKSGTGQDVCAPCTFHLDAQKRKETIRIDDLIVAKGGFEAPPPGTPEGMKTGYGIIVVNGDSDGVNLQGFVVNSHTSAFDLSVFGFDPQPILAAP